MVNNVEELASCLSYEIVKEVAPEELDLFDDINEEYHTNPGDFLKKDNKGEEKILGFDYGVGEVLITTMILPLVGGIIAHICKDGIETLKDEGSKALSAWIRDILQRKSAQPSKESLKLMRDYVYNNALSVGIEKEKACLIAKLVIGKLALI